MTGSVSAPASEIGTVTWTITNGTRRPQLAVDLGPSAAAAHLLFDEPVSLVAFMDALNDAYWDFKKAIEDHATAAAVAEHARRLPGPPGPDEREPGIHVAAQRHDSGPGVSIADDTLCVHCGENTRPRVADGTGARCADPVECGLAIGRAEPLEPLPRRRVDCK